jgi:hypothetical protein
MLGVRLSDLNQPTTSAELRQIFLGLLKEEPQTVKQIKKRLLDEHNISKDSPNVSNRLKNMCDSMPTVRCQQVSMNSQQRIFSYWKVPIVDPKKGQTWQCNKTIVSYRSAGYPGKGDKVEVCGTANGASMDVVARPEMVIFKDAVGDSWSMPVADFTLYYRSM